DRRRVVQPIEGRPARRRAGRAAGRAAIALLLVAVDADVASVVLPLVRTGRIGAEYAGRVHETGAPGRVSQTRLALACPMRPVLVISSRPPRFGAVVPCLPALCLTPAMQLCDRPLRPAWAAPAATWRRRIARMASTAGGPMIAAV